MAVIRPSFPEDHFTRVPNAWLRDPNLDPAPKAYLCYLLSHSAGYACSTSQAARDMGVNRSTVSAWNAKLVERGYFAPIPRRQQGDGGRYVENDYSVTTCTTTPPPLHENRAGVHENRAEVSGEPARSTVTEKPRTVEPSRTIQHIEEQGEKNPGRRTPEQLLVELPLDGADLFDEFWRAYPKKVGKDAARRAWRKAVRRADPDKIVTVARVYPYRDDRAYVKDPATWLNAGCWEDDLDAVAAGNRHRIVTGSGYGPSYREGDLPPDAHRGAF